MPILTTNIPLSTAPERACLLATSAIGPGAAPPETGAFVATLGAGGATSCVLSFPGCPAPLSLAPGPDSLCIVGFANDRFTLGRGKPGMGSSASWPSTWRARWAAWRPSGCRITGPWWWRVEAGGVWSGVEWRWERGRSPRRDPRDGPGLIVLVALDQHGHDDGPGLAQTTDHTHRMTAVAMSQLPQRPIQGSSLHHSHGLPQEHGLNPLRAPGWEAGVWLVLASSSRRCIFGGNERGSNRGRHEESRGVKARSDGSRQSDAQRP